MLVSFKIKISIDLADGVDFSFEWDTVLEGVISCL